MRVQVRLPQNFEFRVQVGIRVQQKDRVLSSSSSSLNSSSQPWLQFINHAFYCTRHLLQINRVRIPCSSVTLLRASVLIEDLIAILISMVVVITPRARF